MNSTPSLDADVGPSPAGKPTKPDYTNIPSAVFCQPPLGTVGMTEAQAVDAGHTCDIYTASFTPMKISLAGRVEKAFMKLIAGRPGHPDCLLID